MSARRIERMGPVARGAAVLALAVAAARCGGAASDPQFGGGGDDGGGTAPPSFGEGGTSAPPGVDHGLVRVTPSDATLDVGAPGVTLAYQAFLAGESAPHGATWSVDDATLGTIDASGVFTASAAAAGVVHVQAQIGGELGSTSLTIRLHVRENPGGVDTTTQGGLEHGGTSDGAFRWLYPYDRTVFPRGLTGPTLQFDGTPPDALLLRVTSKLFTYEGFFKPSAASQLALPAVLWNALTLSAGAGDPVSVDVTKSTGGAVSGPIHETWTIAQGSLKGTVYYNTYTSPKANGVGAVMRIRPGQDAEVFLGGLANGCTVCHTVSANGSTLVAAHGTSEVLADYNSGTAYDLKGNGAPIHQQSDSAFSFGALTPDGTLLLSNGALPRANPLSSFDWAPNVPGQTEGPRPSRLYDPRTGAAVPAKGWDGVVTSALMPAFSPDGRQVAFNHYDTGKGHSLAVMPFDQASRTFGALADVASDSSAYLGWPSFTPDGAAVVFETDNRPDYATWQGARGDLAIVDLASKTVTPLDALNGIEGGKVTLPYGDAEAHLDYEPTMLPVAVGGYFWVVFTSLREYGNTITDPALQDVFTRRRKLWVAAIDIGPAGPTLASAPGHDPSHPAFYLPGQELAAGNMRGFWALDPCKALGAGCGSGAECCDGFCRADASGKPVCTAAPTGCANEYEVCTKDGDCCGASAGYRCIGGHCTEPPAPR